MILNISHRQSCFCNFTGLLVPAPARSGRPSCPAVPQPSPGTPASNHRPRRSERGTSAESFWPTCGCSRGSRRLPQLHQLTNILKHVRRKMSKHMHPTHPPRCSIPPRRIPSAGDNPTKPFFRQTVQYIKQWCMEHNNRGFSIW